MIGKTVLITGSNGLLAYDLIRVFSFFSGEKNYNFIRSNHADFDIVNEKAVKKFVDFHKPDIIINTAALVKVDECELNPGKAFETNAIGALNVAKAAKDIGALNVYIGTNYVFDGGKKSYSEDDAPNPVNIYGASKLAGEALTKIAGGDYYIIRTSWLYGIHRKDSVFVSQVLESAKKGEAIKVVDNQFGTPTYTLDLARKIKELVDKKAPSGVYHITNSGFCSWYGFAEKILELRGARAELVAIKLKERCLISKKPANSILINGNIKKIGIEELRPWNEALKDYIKEAYGD
ncbi:dTDP-4-dehydrorhamnose reductase [Candidatus Azambacteria bacterium]|nr:dTDP-4-dehydrorhamnose reductase [Candidatus Azambacteria bacterium]